jgi:chromate transporter
VLKVFLRLGLTSFGGPVAHLGYFREEFVTRRRWLDDRGYADLVALCQFLPGPASSQVGIAVGLLRAGYAGALAAWTGFTLPSALAMVLFAYGATALGDAAGSGWLHGLKVAAVAVVAQAVLGMARTLAPDRPRATMAVAARDRRTGDSFRLGPGQRNPLRRRRGCHIVARRAATRPRRAAASCEPESRPPSCWWCSLRC